MKTITSWILLGLLGLVLPLAGAAAEQQIPDARILIDISGSMKKNDPRYLRRPALRLMVGLLPADSRAGVWTFGQYVNMQVPLGKVDDAWRNRARDGAGKIHSRGLFTNIEEAIERATRDWSGEAGKYRRDLVLLTDGMVDVSKDPSKSAASRRNIIEQQLPRLKQLGARVYTIALSERADKELMQKLSGETGGWYEQAESAEQLQRIFLRIFEKVGQPDTLPLKDNRFSIDSSIREATLLVFRKEGAEPTRVKPPKGEAFSAENAPPNVSWHRDEGYDLLTLKNPEPGEWGIQADVDPDNRVMVVTDLRLQVTELPNRALLGARMPVEVSFSDQGKAITERKFLDLVSVNAEVNSQQQEGEPWPVDDKGEAPDSVAGDGVFTFSLEAAQQPGRVELVVTAQGSTFQRQKRQSLDLVNPVQVSAMPQEQSGNAGMQVRVVPELGLLEPGSARIEAFVVDDQGGKTPAMFLPAADGKALEGWIDLSSFSDQRKLGLHLAARGSDGVDVSLDLDPVDLQGVKVEQAEPPAPAPMAAPPEPPPAPEPPPEQETDWVMVGSVFGGINLLLVLLAGGAFWFLRRRRTANEFQLVEEPTETVEVGDD